MNDHRESILRAIRAIDPDFDPDAEEPKSRPIVEAQIATLHETFARYAAPCPFQPGDIVTARAGYGHRGVGIPHVVLDVRPPTYAFAAHEPADTTSNAYGRRLDIRVAAIAEKSDNNAICCWWVESWEFETFVPKT